MRTLRLRTVKANGNNVVAKRILLFLIQAYQKNLSPLKGTASCRFYPTCSQYAFEAVSRHGARKGGWMAFRRVLRCHPFHPGGYDPVP